MSTSKSEAYTDLTVAIPSSRVHLATGAIDARLITVSSELISHTKDRNGLAGKLLIAGIWAGIMCDYCCLWPDTVRCCVTDQFGLLCNIQLSPRWRAICETSRVGTAKQPPG